MDELHCVYQLGESFLPEARRFARDHGGGLVELIQADLFHYEWNAGPIKILLVDAMKTATIARQVANTFYPSLTVGSLLIHQDFKHYYTSWIHILQYRLRQFFQFYQSVVGSGTLAFELVEIIPSTTVERATNFANVTDDEIEASFRFSFDLVEASDALYIASAHVMHYIHLGHKQRALELFDTYRSQGFSEKGEFPKVLECLKQMR